MKRPEKHRLQFIAGYGYECTDIDPLLDRLDELEAEEIRRNTYPNKVGREAVRVTADDKWCFNTVQADKKPFPSLQECLKWWKFQENPSLNDFYNYFAQFQYERVVYPKVGDMVEGRDMYEDTIKHKAAIEYFVLETDIPCINIRPATPPTREEVTAKYGLTDSDLKALGVSNALRTWIIENAEDVTGQDGVKWNAIDRDEILNYLKGQDNDF